MIYQTGKVPQKNDLAIGRTSSDPYHAVITGGPKVAYGSQRFPQGIALYRWRVYNGKSYEDGRELGVPP